MALANLIVQLLLAAYLYTGLLRLHARRWVRFVYLAFTGVMVLGLFARLLRRWADLNGSPWLVPVFAYFVALIVGGVFLGLVDLVALVEFTAGKLAKRKVSLGRRKALTQIALVGATAPFLSVLAGGLFAYAYRIHRLRIPIVGLPQGWDGATLVHLSDLHLGSLKVRTAVLKGFEMVKTLKPDVLVFSGDLVNDLSTEADEWLSELRLMQGKLGSLSVLGNHDYGDYHQWDSPEAKAANLARLKGHHNTVGWNLLLDQTATLHRNGDVLRFAGVQNWSARRAFQRYGSLQRALAGQPLDAAAGPIVLISHDPSHWDAEVHNYPSVALTLSGHTHGMQAGIEVGKFQFSPAQWIYKQWAGLYQLGQQSINVNRGFGFIGYPGRIGILPEITHITLVRA